MCQVDLLLSIMTKWRMKSMMLLGFYLVFLPLEQKKSVTSKIEC